MKNALITGVAGGMGGASAKKLVGDGYHVFGLDINEPEHIESLDFIQTDLTDSASVDNSKRIIEGKGITLDCIINLAGMYDLGSLVEMNEERFIRIFNVNLFSVYRVNKTFLPLLKDDGRIIITSSELAPLDPLPFTGIYGVTKAAVEKYAYSLRMELQLLGRKVIVLRPGAVDTGLLDVSTSRLDEFTKTTALYSCNAEQYKEIVDRVEARKVRPEKIAATVSKALSSKHPKYVYKVNRNPLLLMLDMLPDRWQNGIIKRILK